MDQKWEIYYSNSNSTMVRNVSGNGHAVAIIEASWTPDHKEIAERMVAEHNALAAVKDIPGFMDKVENALELVNDFACNLPEFYFENFETEEGDTVDSPNEQVKAALALFPKPDTESEVG